MLASLDVSMIRAWKATTVVERSPTQRLLVLGSSQPESIVSEGARRDRDLLVVRRRGGGGAVAIDPSSTIWIDVWIPRGSPSFDVDVIRSLERVGDLTLEAFRSLGITDLRRAERREVSVGDVACFSAIGHGEILDRSGAKVLGVTAWRCREGALFQTASYLRRETAMLVASLDLDASHRAALREELDRTTGLLPEALGAHAQTPELAVQRGLLARSMASVLTGPWGDRAEVARLPEVLAER